MFRFLLLLTIIGAAWSVEPLDVDIFVTNDVTLLDIPEGEFLLPLERTFDSKGLIEYTLGNRVNGDRLVAQGSDSRTWPNQQNIQLTLRYPPQGSGATVTAVKINVNQNSNLGRAYVVQGGIGQKSIVIIVEAQSVTSFSYTASIWGL